MFNEYYARIGSVMYVMSCQRQGLNHGQLEAANLFLEGHSLFITGEAGTGKSFLTSKMVKYCKSKYRADEFVYLTFTGLLAVMLGAQTFHSFTGIGVPETHEDIKLRVRACIGRWRPLKIMIIDEVSNFSGELLDVVFGAVQDELKENSQQLVMCGHFPQLRPIVRDPTASAKEAARTKDLHLLFNRGFAFQSSVWREAKITNVKLIEVIRQTDQTLVAALRDLSRGEKTPRLMSVMSQCNRSLPPLSSSFSSTLLLPRCEQVWRKNDDELDKLPGDPKVFKSQDGVTLEDGTCRPRQEGDESLWREFPCDDELSLKLQVSFHLLCHESCHACRHP